jgi:zinc protease
MKLRFISLLLFVFLLNTIPFAQSGRSRSPAPPPQPKPTTKQPPPATRTILNLPEGGKVVKYETDGATARFVLKNGLTVIIRERHSTPLAAVTTYVKAGYFNEADEVAGLAHLMEHMFFKGTTARPVGTIAPEIAKLGGVFNASTSYEKTSYYAIAPAESLPKILEIQADMLQNPTFDAEELKKEALVVIQESKRKQDNASALALEKMYATAFTAHRMKRWRIGAENVLQAATREQLQAFYQDFYRPENTVLVIVGAVQVNQVIPQVQQLYARFGSAPKVETKAEVQPEKKETSAKATASTSKPEPKAQGTAPTPDNAQAPASQVANPQAQVPSAQSPTLPSPLGLEEPVQEKLRYATERGDIGQAVVTIGYHAPALTNTAAGLKEQATMEVLAAVLGLGRGARLTSVMREKSAVVSSLNVEYLPLPTVGILAAQMQVAPDRLDHAEGEYFREIEKFRREILSEGELQRAKVMLEKTFYDSISSLHNEAEILAHYESQYGDFRLLNSYIDRIRAVTAKDLQQMAAKVLALNNTTVFEYEPRNAPARTFAPDKFAEAMAILAPASAQPIKPEDVKPAVALKQFQQGKERSLGSDEEKVIFTPIPLPIKDFSIYRGPRAYVREDKSHPTLTVGVFFQGGRLTEDQATSGMTELMLRVMRKGTMTRKGDLIALELENYGGEVRIVNEPDFFGFTLDVLSRNAEKALGVLLEIIENPYFDKAELARERDGLLAHQLQRRDDSVQRPIDLALASLYPGHPYGLPRYGLPAAVKAANEETLEAWYKKSIRRQFPLVILVGDTDGSALVSSIFSEAFKRSSGELDQTLKVNLSQSFATPQEIVEQRNRKQTAQAFAFRTPPPAQINNYALMVLQNYASGMGGRLFDELRDKQSLAYTVMLRHQQGLANGSLLAYIATSPENEGRARGALLKELEDLSKTPPTEDEFKRGRNGAIGAYAVALQSHPTRLLEYARAVIFGRKVTEVESQPDLIRAVKKDDIKATVDAIIKLNAAGLGVVRGEQTPSVNKN